MNRQLPGRRSAFGWPWLQAGVTVAVLDITFACVYWVGVRHATTIAGVLHSIASAVLGSVALTGGVATATLGAALHLAIAFGWTTLFALLLATVPGLRLAVIRPATAVLVGAVTGVVIWLAMDLVIVPLSHARATPIRSPVFVVMLVWHAIGVGLPMVLLLRRGLATDPRRSE